MNRTVNDSFRPYRAAEEMEPNRDVLLASPVMAHLLHALDNRVDIEDFGRLTFVLAGRHFLEPEEMVRLLACQPNIGQVEARALVEQVIAHDYSPPTLEQIQDWQAAQTFPICPDPEDGEDCDLYQQLPFPAEIIERVDALQTR